MADALTREFLALEVRETSQGRGYWLDRTWVDEAERPALARADVLVLPQLSGEDEVPVFPVGSEAVLTKLRELLGPQISLGVAIRSADYQELALHSKAWRLPTLLVSSVALPLVLNVLGNRIDDLLFGHKEGDTAEITLIVEGPNHKALKLHYKGDARDMGDLLARSVPRFIDELDSGPGALPQVHRRHHGRQAERGS